MRTFLILALALALSVVADYTTDVQFVPALQPLPPVRSAPQMVLAGNKAVMLFGFLECFFESSCDNYFYNDTWIADLSDSPVAWESANPSALGGVYPGLRTFFGSDYYANSGKVVFFGGVMYNADLSVFVVYSDIWYYNIALNRYEPVTFPAGTGPGPRIGVTLKVIGDSFYFFGGFDATFTGHNDMWKFDLVHKTWTLLIADSSSPSAPSGRYLYSCVLDLNLGSQGRYYIYSGDTVDNGVQFSSTNDTWYYDFATNSYVQVFSTADPTSPGRTHGASALHRNHFFVVDGEENSNEDECPTVSLAGPQGPQNSITFLDLHDTSAGWQYADLGVDNIGLKRIAGVTLHGVFYFTTGFGFACPSDPSSVPIWNPYLFSVDLNSLLD